MRKIKGIWNAVLETDGKDKELEKNWSLFLPKLEGKEDQYRGVKLGPGLT